MVPQKQYACNRFYLSANDVINQNTVVILNQEGFYLEHSPLSGERPYVEWLGGIFFLDVGPGDISGSRHVLDTFFYLV